jgi:hypothetical protein
MRPLDVLPTEFSRFSAVRLMTSKSPRFWPSAYRFRICIRLMSDLYTYMLGTCIYSEPWM